MTTQLTTFNAAQACIYTRSNLSRAFQGFDDTDITSISLRDDTCVVVRTDGSEQSYPRETIKTAYQDYTNRLKDFFAYLGPNYRGPSIWHQNAYIMFKGWNYTHSLGHLTSNAKLQGHWIDKFIHLTDPQKVTTLLQSDQTDLGHLVAPDGLRLPTGRLTSALTVNKNPTQDPLRLNLTVHVGPFNVSWQTSVISKWKLRAINQDAST
jgi:hypothetical protein